ncbi:bifunctional phosphopantothenoylcysteine decarboxylase/phosphopantothenate--cysteine ligase CoaBC [bacterium]|nr:bifunctional phosphopantothenoylcysteine decarboxylase/phosphopantothenate--cysteine ligase CoaBC [bacterium]
MLSGKTVLLGITGGIAAYKICELIRKYKRANATVKIVCTPNALNFVTKLTLQTLSKNNVYVNEFDIKDYNPEHISLADEADIMVIAPATANTISKIATGVCDNLLTSIACAYTKPLIIAPAMNCNMWGNPIIQENLHKLHYTILEPEEGFLACGYSGKGRLCSVDKIFEKTVELLNYKPLTGKRIVITSGGTIEEIDPVRYISNYSSGKMGLALADCAKNLGAEVTLITTKDVSKKYNVIKVKSALDMKKAVEKEFDNSDYIIMASAVADYRAKEISSQKMKKTEGDEITLTLIKNPDILKELCKKKKACPPALRPSSPLIVGFCAESENLLENAKEKINKKGCDYLIANDISRKDIGFSSDYNEVFILNKNGETKHIEKADKSTVAYKILEYIVIQRLIS